jgi:Ala-tRNA(Pro) deacylase
MAIALSLLQYLETADVDYQVIHHPHSSNSIDTAKASHVSGRRLAKGVVVEDTEGNYLMAVIPANRHLDLTRLHHQLDRHVGLATEDELLELFPDCEPGAVPPLGAAYGLEMIVDEDLEKEPEIFLEGGFHDDVIQMSGLDFSKLIVDTPDGNISRPM